MDIHTETAKLMFHTKDVTPEMRAAAKRINFLDLYGGSGSIPTGNLPTKEKMEEFMRSFDTSELRSVSLTMYDRACEIKDLADSEYYSDSHITEMSERFKADFGCDWTEILN